MVSLRRMPLAALGARLTDQARPNVSNAALNRLLSLGDALVVPWCPAICRRVGEGSRTAALSNRCCVRPAKTARPCRIARQNQTFVATGAAVDFYNVLAGELRRHPELARTFYEAGPARTINNLAAILAGADDQLAIDDPVSAAEALFGLWQGATNFQLSLGVDTETAEVEIARRVDFGIAVFMRAFARPVAAIDEADRDLW